MAHNSKSPISRCSSEVCTVITPYRPSIYSVRGSFDGCVPNWVGAGARDAWKHVARVTTACGQLQHVTKGAFGNPHRGYGVRPMDAYTT